MVPKAVMETVEAREAREAKEAKEVREAVEAIAVMSTTAARRPWKTRTGWNAKRMRKRDERNGRTRWRARWWVRWWTRFSQPPNTFPKCINSHLLEKFHSNVKILLTI